MKKDATNSGVKKYRVETYSDPAVTAKEAGKYLSDLLSQYLDQPILLLLAGGSSLEVVEHINPEYLTSLITVTVTDDRFSEELDENNFAMLQATSFYNHLIGAEAFCIDTQVSSGESFEEYAGRFEKNIREWKRDFPAGKIIALYGMGNDGHTAGMIPGILDKSAFDAEFNLPEKLVGSMDASSKAPFLFRISTTIPFMKTRVDHALFYITGEAKRTVLEEVLAKSDISSDYFELPARVMTEMKDTVIFTDISLDI